MEPCEHQHSTAREEEEEEEGNGRPRNRGRYSGSPLHLQELTALRAAQGKSDVCPPQRCPGLPRPEGVTSPSAAPPSRSPTACRSAEHTLRYLFSWQLRNPINF